MGATVNVWVPSPRLLKLTGDDGHETGAPSSVQVNDGLGCPLASNANVASPLGTVPDGPEVMSVSGCTTVENPTSSSPISPWSVEISADLIVAEPSELRTTSGAHLPTPGDAPAVVIGCPVASKAVSVISGGVVPRALRPLGSDTMPKTLSSACG